MCGKEGALESITERNHYGYPETYCYFNDLWAARALIGHPRIYRPGDRDNPIKIVEQPPQLVVAEAEDGHIGIALDPPPPAHGEFRTRHDGSQRVVFTYYDQQLMKLHQTLGGKLKVPASAAGEVVESIQRVASLVAVQSEIGLGETGGRAGSGGQRVDADPRPHVHLLPYQSES